MMEQSKHTDVVEAIFGLVDSPARGEHVGQMRELAVERMEHGYPREALLEDFEAVRSTLEDRDRDADEDDVVVVMDALTGYCSPAALL